MNNEFNQIGGNPVSSQLFSSKNTNPNLIVEKDEKTRRRAYLANFQEKKMQIIKNNLVSDFLYAEKIAKRYSNAPIKNNEFSHKKPVSKKYKSTFNRDRILLDKYLTNISTYKGSDFWPDDGDNSDAKYIQNKYRINKSTIRDDIEMLNSDEMEALTDIENRIKKVDDNSELKKILGARDNYINFTQKPIRITTVIALGLGAFLVGALYIAPAGLAATNALGGYIGLSGLKLGNVLFANKFGIGLHCFFIVKATASDAFERGSVIAVNTFKQQFKNSAKQYVKGIVLYKIRNLLASSATSGFFKLNHYLTGSKLLDPKFIQNFNGNNFQNLLAGSYLYMGKFTGQFVTRSAMGAFEGGLSMIAEIPQLQKYLSNSDTKRIKAYEREKKRRANHENFLADLDRIRRRNNPSLADVTQKHWNNFKDTYYKISQKHPVMSSVFTIGISVFFSNFVLDKTFKLGKNLLTNVIGKSSYTVDFATRTDFLKDVDPNKKFKFDPDGTGEQTLTPKELMDKFEEYNKKKDHDKIVKIWTIFRGKNLGDGDYGGTNLQGDYDGPAISHLTDTQLNSLFYRLGLDGKKALEAENLDSDFAKQYSSWFDKKHRVNSGKFVSRFDLIKSTYIHHKNNLEALDQNLDTDEKKFLRALSRVSSATDEVENIYDLGKGRWHNKFSDEMDKDVFETMINDPQVKKKSSEVGKPQKPEPTDIASDSEGQGDDSEGQGDNNYKKIEQLQENRMINNRYKPPEQRFKKDTKVYKVGNQDYVLLHKPIDIDDKDWPDSNLKLKSGNGRNKHFLSEGEIQEQKDFDLEMSKWQSCNEAKITRPDMCNEYIGTEKPKKPKSMLEIRTFLHNGKYHFENKIMSKPPELEGIVMAHNPGMLGIAGAPMRYVSSLFEQAIDQNEVRDYIERTYINPYLNSYIADILPIKRFLMTKLYKKLYPHADSDARISINDFKKLMHKNTSSSEVNSLLGNLTKKLIFKSVETSIDIVSIDGISYVRENSSYFINNSKRIYDTYIDPIIDAVGNADFTNVMELVNQNARDKYEALYNMQAIIAHSKNLCSGPNESDACYRSVKLTSKFKDKTRTFDNPSEFRDHLLNLINKYREAEFSSSNHDDDDDDDESQNILDELKYYFPDAISEDLLNSEDGLESLLIFSDFTDYGKRVGIDNLPELNLEKESIKFGSILSLFDQSFSGNDADENLVKFLEELGWEGIPERYQSIWSNSRESVIRQYVLKTDLAPGEKQTVYIGLTSPVTLDNEQTEKFIQDRYLTPEQKKKIFEEFLDNLDITDPQVITSIVESSGKFVNEQILGESIHSDTGEVTYTEPSYWDMIKSFFLTSTGQLEEMRKIKSMTFILRAKSKVHRDYLKGKSKDLLDHFDDSRVFTLQSINDKFNKFNKELEEKKKELLELLRGVKSTNSSYSDLREQYIGDSSSISPDDFNSDNNKNIVDLLYYIDNHLIQQNNQNIESNLADINAIEQRKNRLNNLNNQIQQDSTSMLCNEYGCSDGGAYSEMVSIYLNDQYQNSIIDNKINNQVLRTTDLSNNLNTIDESIILYTENSKKSEKLFQKSLQIDTQIKEDIKSLEDLKQSLATKFVEFKSSVADIKNVILQRIDEYRQLYKDNHIDENEYIAKLNQIKNFIENNLGLYYSSSLGTELGNLNQQLQSKLITASEYHNNYITILESLNFNVVNSGSSNLGLFNQDYNNNLAEFKRLKAYQDELHLIASFFKENKDYDKIEFIYDDVGKQYKFKLPDQDKYLYLSSIDKQGDKIVINIDNISNMYTNIENSIETLQNQINNNAISKAVNDDFTQMLTDLGSLDTDLENDIVKRKGDLKQTYLDSIETLKNDILQQYTNMENTLSQNERLLSTIQTNNNIFLPKLIKINRDIKNIQLSAGEKAARTKILQEIGNLENDIDRDIPIVDAKAKALKTEIEKLKTELNNQLKQLNSNNDVTSILNIKNQINALNEKIKGKLNDLNMVLQEVKELEAQMQRKDTLIEDLNSLDEQIKADSSKRFNLQIDYMGKKQEDNTDDIKTLRTKGNTQLAYIESEKKKVVTKIESVKERKQQLLKTINDLFSNGHIDKKTKDNLEKSLNNIPTNIPSQLTNQILAMTNTQNAMDGLSNLNNNIAVLLDYYTNLSQDTVVQFIKNGDNYEFIIPESNIVVTIPVILFKSPRTNLDINLNILQNLQQHIDKRIIYVNQIILSSDQVDIYSNSINTQLNNLDSSLNTFSNYLTQLKKTVMNNYKTSFNQESANASQNLAFTSKHINKMQATKLKGLANLQTKKDALLQGDNSLLADQEKKAINNKFQKIQKEKKDLDSDMQKFEQEKQAITQKLNNANTKLKNLNNEILDAVQQNDLNKVKNLKNEINVLNKQIYALNNNLKNINQKFQELQNKSANYNNQLQNFELLLAQLTEESNRRNLQIKLNSARSKQITETNSNTSNTINQELSKISNEIQETELQINNINDLLSSGSLSQSDTDDLSTHLKSLEAYLAILNKSKLDLESLQSKFLDQMRENANYLNSDNWTKFQFQFKGGITTSKSSFTGSQWHTLQSGINNAVAEFKQTENQLDNILRERGGLMSISDKYKYDKEVLQVLVDKYFKNMGNDVDEMNNYISLLDNIGSNFPNNNDIHKLIADIKTLQENIKNIDSKMNNDDIMKLLTDYINLNLNLQTIIKPEHAHLLKPEHSQLFKNLQEDYEKLSIFTFFLIDPDSIAANGKDALSRSKKIIKEFSVKKNEVEQKLSEFFQDFSGHIDDAQKKELVRIFLKSGKNLNVLDSYLSNLYFLNGKKGKISKKQYNAQLTNIENKLQSQQKQLQSQSLNIRFIKNLFIKNQDIFKNIDSAEKARIIRKLSNDDNLGPNDPDIKKIKDEWNKYYNIEISNLEILRSRLNEVPTEDQLLSLVVRDILYTNRQNQQTQLKSFSNILNLDTSNSQMFSSGSEITQFRRTTSKDLNSLNKLSVIVEKSIQEEAPVALVELNTKEESVNDKITATNTEKDKLEKQKESNENKRDLYTSFIHTTVKSKRIGNFQTPVKSTGNLFALKKEQIRLDQGLLEIRQKQIGILQGEQSLQSIKGETIKTKTGWFTFGTPDVSDTRLTPEQKKDIQRNPDIDLSQIATIGELESEISKLKETNANDISSKEGEIWANRASQSEIISNINANDPNVGIISYSRDVNNFKKRIDKAKSPDEVDKLADDIASQMKEMKTKIENDRKKIQNLGNTLYGLSEELGQIGKEKNEFTLGNQYSGQLNNIFGVGASQIITKLDSFSHNLGEEGKGVIIQAIQYIDTASALSIDISENEQLLSEIETVFSDVQASKGVSKQLAHQIRSLIRKSKGETVYDISQDIDLKSETAENSIQKSLDNIDNLYKELPDLYQKISQKISTQKKILSETKKFIKDFETAVSNAKNAQDFTKNLSEKRIELKNSQSYKDGVAYLEEPGDLSILEINKMLLQNSEAIKTDLNSLETKLSLINTELNSLRNTVDYTVINPQESLKPQYRAKFKLDMDARLKYGIKEKTEQGTKLSNKNKESFWQSTLTAFKNIQSMKLKLKNRQSLNPALKKRLNQLTGEQIEADKVLSILGTDISELKEKEFNIINDILDDFYDDLPEGITPLIKGCMADPTNEMCQNDGLVRLHEGESLDNALSNAASAYNVARFTYAAATGIGAAVKLGSVVKGLATASTGLSSAGIGFLVLQGISAAKTFHTVSQKLQLAEDFNRNIQLGRSFLKKESIRDVLDDRNKLGGLGSVNTNLDRAGSILRTTAHKAHTFETYLKDLGNQITNLPSDPASSKWRLDKLAFLIFAQSGGSNEKTALTKLYTDVISTMYDPEYSINDDTDKDKEKMASSFQKVTKYCEGDDCYEEDKSKPNENLMKGWKYIDCKTSNDDICNDQTFDQSSKKIWVKRSTIDNIPSRLQQYYNLRKSNKDKFQVNPRKFDLKLIAELKKMPDNKDKSDNEIYETYKNELKNIIDFLGRVQIKKTKPYVKKLKYDQYSTDEADSAGWAAAKKFTVFGDLFWGGKEATAGLKLYEKVLFSASARSTEIHSLKNRNTITGLLEVPDWAEYIYYGEERYEKDTHQKASWHETLYTGGGAKKLGYGDGNTLMTIGDNSLNVFGYQLFGGDPYSPLTIINEFNQAGLFMEHFKKNEKTFADGDGIKIVGSGDNKKYRVYIYNILGEKTSQHIDIDPSIKRLNSIELNKILSTPTGKKFSSMLSSSLKKISLANELVLNQNQDLKSGGFWRMLGKFRDDTSLIKKVSEIHDTNMVNLKKSFLELDDLIKDGKDQQQIIKKTKEINDILLEMKKDPEIQIKSLYTINEIIADIEAFSKLDGPKRPEYEDIFKKFLEIDKMSKFRSYTFLSGTDLAVASFAASLTDVAVGSITSVKDVRGKNPIIRGKIDIPTDKGFQYKVMDRFNFGFRDISVPIVGPGVNLGDKTTAIRNMKQAKNVIYNARQVIGGIVGIGSATAARSTLISSSDNPDMVKKHMKAELESMRKKINEWNKETKKLNGDKVRKDDKITNFITDFIEKNAINEDKDGNINLDDEQMEDFFRYMITEVEKMAKEQETGYIPRVKDIDYWENEIYQKTGDMDPALTQEILQIVNNNNLEKKDKNLLLLRLQIGRYFKNIEEEAKSVAKQDDESESVTKQEE